jgi:hypothetical protein
MFCGLFSAGITVYGGATLKADEVPDIDTLSVEEINRLPAETKMQLPARELIHKLFKAGDAAPVMYNTMVDVPLFNLFYLGELPVTATPKARDAAVRKFQHDIDAAQTGELTFGQLMELGRRSLRVKENEIALSLLEPKIHKFDDWVLVSNGTWIIEGDTIARPINTSTIRCYRDYGTCFEASVYMEVPTFDDVDADTAYYPDLTFETYHIIKWTDAEVVAETESDCRVSTLSLNVKSNEVLEVTRNNSEAGCGIPGLFELPKLVQPRIARLVKGYDVSRAFFAKRSDAARLYYNSEFRNVLEQLLVPRRPLH